MWAKQGQMQIKNLGNTLFVLLGKDGCAKSDGTFGKVPKGGGREVIFNQKIYVADFRNFKQGFLSMKLIQSGNFWVQGPVLFSYRHGRHDGGHTTS